MAEHFEKLQRMYLSAKINTMIFDTTTIDIVEGEAKISLQITDKYFHALNATHGSVYFKMLDDAAFFAVSSIVTDFFVLTASFNIQLTRPVNSGIITAKGKVKFQSKNLFVAEASLYDEKGREIAFGTGNFMKSKIELSKEIGYE
ncbi:MAG: PaaI family thioesterase [Opitutaceae bacterium]|nr:PaaI family thioesterase [Cytophagales bacterium]